MANEENVDDSTTQNEVKGVEDIDFSDAEAAQEAYQSVLAEQEKVSEQNKQLFARAKKAEGFELKDGEWVKPEPNKEDTEKGKEEPKDDTQPSKEPSKPDGLDFGELAFYNTKSDVNKIESDEDIEFLEKTIADTGKSQKDVLNSNWFQSELAERAEARQSQDAIPKGKGRPGQSGLIDVDLAYAKFLEDGTLPYDLKTRSEVVKRAEQSEKNEGMFDGPSVIGPRQ